MKVADKEINAIALIVDMVEGDIDVPGEGSQKVPVLQVGYVDDNSPADVDRILNIINIGLPEDLSMAVWERLGEYLFRGQDDIIEATAKESI